VDIIWKRYDKSDHATFDKAGVFKIIDNVIFDFRTEVDHRKLSEIMTVEHKEFLDLYKAFSRNNDPDMEYRKEDMINLIKGVSGL